jgi:hypothetical protein
MYLGLQNQALGLRISATIMITKLEGLKSLREFGEKRKQ